MKVIDFFKATEKRDFIDCRLTSFRDILRYYGMKIDSYDVFILGRVMSTSCYNFKLSKIPFDMILFSGTTFKFENNLFNNLGIRYEKKIFDDDIRKTISEHIDSEIPILFELDIRYLKDKDFCKKKLDIHCVSDSLICGYDFSNGKDVVYISLKDENSSDLTEVSVETLIKAITSQTFPVELKKAYYEIDTTSIDTDIFDSNNVFIKERLWQFADAMLMPEKYVLDTNNINKILYSGDGVIETVRRNNKEVVNYLTNNQNGCEVNKRLAAMYFMALRDMLTPGSDYCYRLEFSEVVRKFSDKLDLVELADESDRFGKLSKMWRNLTRTLYQCSKIESEDDICSFANKVDKQLLDINEFERNEFLEIKTIIENHKC
ncbi:MAG: BtrH N-terminal domain-containing protein [Hominimerdicola sp.]